MVEHNYFEFNYPTELLIKTDCKKYFETEVPLSGIVAKGKSFCYNVLQEKFVNFLDNHNTIHTVVLFKKSANDQRMSAHVDIKGNLTRNLYALNLVLPCNDYGSMEWYDTKDGLQLPILFDESKNQYCRELVSNLNLIEQFSITTKPCLIRTDIPHRVKIASCDRYCISIRFQHNYKDWSEVIDSYKKLNDISYFK